MQRKRVLLAALLLLAMAVSLMGRTSAEKTQDKEWKADLTTLLSAAEIPASTTIEFDLRLDENAQLSEKTFAKDLISSKGDVLRVEVACLLDEEAKAGWSEISAWLDGVVVRSIQSVRADSESLANVVAESIAEQRRSARPDANGALPAWARGGLKIRRITAAVPYYPTLSVGVNGDATQRLQARLKVLGYLDDKVDGYYGNNTKAAVEQLERYVRELEQDVIDAMPEPTPTPSPTPSPTPAPHELPLVIDVPLVTPEPYVAPTPTPATAVDGVADALLQAYLYSDHFQVTRGALSSGDSGDAVRRVQLRLRQLGYMTDAADGIYGGSTARSLRIFQYYNGLEQTGVADVATQQKLFSESAVKPDNAMLTVGSRGDDVSKLQKSLRVLGFAAISIDGSFGSSTRVGVENLQKYMRELEEELIGDGDRREITVEVNGIADPLLLQDFYSESFPAIPAAMSRGDKGRDVVRLQRRLSMLEYYYDGVDGSYGSDTVKAVKDFQKRNGLSVTGEADTATLRTLFNENAKKALKPYVLKVSIADQRVYAYAPDKNGNYTNLVRTMKCSTGRDDTPTPTGTFQSGTGPGAAWHYFQKFDCWAQYAYYVTGDIMFHSVLYNEKEGKVTKSSVNNLGRKASHGCVRLSVEDAKWVWENCPRNTKIIIE